ncbi:olfactory receptor 5G9-like [Pyxicephalus adspersus]|uniref:olfactory receptor 5G9-like n=1 Tax=Pyxicephalus adspersus TaxID=30357 RepID=UPI003B5B095B
MQMITKTKLDSNLTVITNVILLGFQGPPPFRIFCFTFFLFIYCVTMCGNLLIILLVSSNKNLHTPMYFFLTQLSISDILLSSDIVPNLLHLLLHSPIAISFSSCITQLYFFIFAEVYECFLLTVMSYDRYIAICNPLLYNIIMKHETCIKLVLLSGLMSIVPSLVEILTVYNLWFCGPNIIDHFFCDMEPLLDLSCSGSSIVHIEMIVTSIPIAIFPIILIMTSYFYIIYHILKIPSTTSRQKAFPTCISHLTVVSIFYGTMFFTYILPTRGKSATLSKVLAVVYTVLTPLINPIIYSLRNKDIKIALHSWDSSLRPAASTGTGKPSESGASSSPPETPCLEFSTQPSQQSCCAITQEVSNIPVPYFEKKFSSVESAFQLIASNTTRITELEQRISDMEDQAINRQTTITSQQLLLASLSDKYEDLKNKHCRDHLFLIGILESYKPFDLASGYSSANRSTSFMCH